MAPSTHRSLRLRSDMSDFVLQRTVTKSEANILLEDVDGDLFELLSNSYILYEFVIENAHYVYERRVRNNVSSLNIVERLEISHLGRRFIGLHPYTAMSRFY